MLLIYSYISVPDRSKVTKIKMLMSTSAIRLPMYKCHALLYTASMWKTLECCRHTDTMGQLIVCLSATLLVHFLWCLNFMSLFYVYVYVLDELGFFHRQCWAPAFYVNMCASHPQKSTKIRRKKQLRENRLSSSVRRKRFATIPLLFTFLYWP